MKARAWIVGSLVVLIVVLAVSVVACGQAATSTTAAPTTTAAPATTAAPTTEAPATTEAVTTSSEQTVTTAASTTTSAAAIDPAALFTANCELSGCHKSPPRASVATATKVITNGKESMPSFQDKLTADEIAELAQWVANGGN